MAAITTGLLVGFLVRPAHASDIIPVELYAELGVGGLYGTPQIGGSRPAPGRDYYHESSGLCPEQKIAGVLALHFFGQVIECFNDLGLVSLTGQWGVGLEVGLGDVHRRGWAPVFGGTLAGVLGGLFNARSPLRPADFASIGVMTEGQLMARYRFDRGPAFYAGFAAGSHYLFEGLSGPGEARAFEPSFGLQFVIRAGMRFYAFDNLFH